MKERIIFGYDDFVLPFTIGMIFIILYLAVGTLRIVWSLPKEDKLKLFKSILSPIGIFKNIKDIIMDALLHVKIFKRNALLGYMHASIAFGWFMLIVIGHIEVMIYTPQRNGVLYYPVFFRFFVMETQDTLRGAFFFFLMDLFLLMVLSGIFLAFYKRFKSIRLGLKRTTKLAIRDKIAMYSLWAIFPLRLLAESFTADISGGSFLTKSINSLLKGFTANPDNIYPVWWSYSIALGIFMFALPFSRFMHIPTEILTIILRNAGIRASHPRDGYAESEIYSCSSCGICIDACPMAVEKSNSIWSSVYFIRYMRRRSKKALPPADKCLMCNKCVELCPVGIDSCRIKLLKRNDRNSGGIRTTYDYISSPSTNIPKGQKVLYYAGCMTHLTPIIIKSVSKILNHACVDWTFMDKEGSICCGRPLLLSGRIDESKKLMQKNIEIIKESKCSVLLVSCPICYKMFKEEYNLEGIEVMHYTSYFDRLIKEGKIDVDKCDQTVVFHDPCELGRGSGIYDQPRDIIKSIGNLTEANKSLKESICCGGSLGSLSLRDTERRVITKESIKNLTYNSPDSIITACPLCLKSFAPLSEAPVKDIAQLICESIKNNNK